MATDTELAVLAGARRCFFQHGYTASNMTLISQYAGFSRVTVHKHFKNKDDAFRRVCLQFREQVSAASDLILQDQSLSCWQATEQILLAWLTPTFDEVSDHVVMRDLKFYAQEVAEDIFEQAFDEFEDYLEQVFERGAKANEINLQKNHITAKSLAQLVVCAMDGIRARCPKEDVLTARDNLLNIFKAATLTQS